MTTKAAAERLRKAWKGDHWDTADVAEYRGGGWIVDLRDIAEAYLAEHPADDEQAITFDELCEVFADSDDVFPSLRKGVIGASIETYITLATWGQARRLAAALGIELRNPQ